MNKVKKKLIKSVALLTITAGSAIGGVCLAGKNFNEQTEYQELKDQIVIEFLNSEEINQKFFNNIAKLEEKVESKNVTGESLADFRDFLSQDNLEKHLKISEFAEEYENAEKGEFTNGLAAYIYSSVAAGACFCSFASLSEVLEAKREIKASKNKQEMGED